MILGRKNKLYHLNLYFSPSHFPHLCGLHKLTDLYIHKKQRSKIFNDILTRKLTHNDISKSKYIYSIKDRMKFLTILESLLDSNETIYKYNPNIQSFSAIQADFLLTNIVLDEEIYIFLDRDIENNYFCRSLFPQAHTNFKHNQIKFTLLYKEKINLETSENTVQYNRLSPNRLLEIKNTQDNQLLS